MNNTLSEVGRRVRNFRKSRNMTVQQLGGQIHKSRATISKYESGEIAMDIPTLYDISRALNVHVEQLLPDEPNQTHTVSSNIPSAFFRDASRFYTYFYDGRDGSVVRSVLDVMPPKAEGQLNVILYMNIQGYDTYQICENTYYGIIEHYDMITNLFVKNKYTPVEQITISILASFLDAPTKWGLMFGLSSRPIMPIALKMLFSKEPLKENKELIKQLKITKEDIRIMKVYNMFSVM